MSQDFKTQLQFASVFAKQFKLSQPGAHASVVTFSRSATIDVPLSKGSSYPAFKDGLKRVVFKGQDTYLDKGKFFLQKHSCLMKCFTFHIQSLSNPFMLFQKCSILKGKVAFKIRNKF